MQIPNFMTEEGSILYKNTVGKVISPKVAEFVIAKTAKLFSTDIQHVLDVACGPGTVSLHLAEQYPDKQFTGIDASAAMIQQCLDTAKLKGLKNTEFLEMNANTIQFPDRTFDFIICNLAFPFFSRPKESMEGMYHVLKRRGTILVSVPGRNTWKEFFLVAEEVLGDSIPFAKPFLSKFDQAETLPISMTEAGFTIVEQTGHKIPFTFANGQAVLRFFQELFSLLSYAPEEIRNEISETIDKKFPSGFTMHYEAVVVQCTHP
ncbi:class I SAM-dependent methyltransferase [Fodinisporobacter ferrooxydans]|uniref:Class I SAM-dependent methyltransferase n=1 Tax=Fodinisporobacter ferrooxydans TaxID=2901836 RepID=A0ABY4CJX0_9BACL|nr:class I SAM-dependent methyltransferase [Alicyclobacillaceae bacterium MYW30-H2]